MPEERACGINNRARVMNMPDPGVDAHREETEASKPTLGVRKGVSDAGSRCPRYRLCLKERRHGTAPGLVGQAKAGSSRLTWTAWVPFPPFPDADYLLC